MNIKIDLHKQTKEEYPKYQCFQETKVKVDYQYLVVKEDKRKEGINRNQ